MKFHVYTYWEFVSAGSMCKSASNAKIYEWSIIFILVLFNNVSRAYLFRLLNINPANFFTVASSAKNTFSRKSIFTAIPLSCLAGSEIDLNCIKHFYS